MLLNPTIRKMFTGVVPPPAEYGARLLSLGEREKGTRLRERPRTPARRAGLAQIYSVLTAYSRRPLRRGRLCGADHL